jgi:hypothetical protein
MLLCTEVLQQIVAMGQSLPMRSAPVSRYVGNGLKADVPGKWRNGKMVTISRSDVETGRKPLY